MQVDTIRRTVTFSRTTSTRDRLWRLRKIYNKVWRLPQVDQESEQFEELSRVDGCSQRSSQDELFRGLAARLMQASTHGLATRFSNAMDVASRDHYDHLCSNCAAMEEILLWRSLLSSEKRPRN